MHLTADFHFFSNGRKDSLGGKSGEEGIVTENRVKSVACTETSSYIP